MPKENSYVEKKQKNPITYQNKDVISKIFGENLKEKSLAVYGVNIPKIKEVLPTNLPAIEANEMRLDNLFRLEDGSIALVDYESRYKRKDKIKYLGYIVRTLRRKELLENPEKTIRMIVIYTGDVKKGTTESRLDTGCLQFTVEEVFLSVQERKQSRNASEDALIWRKKFVPRKCRYFCYRDCWYSQIK